MRAARADHLGRVLRSDIGPLARQSSELTRVVIEIDTVLAPGLPAID
jgi:hypothetical protein